MGNSQDSNEPVAWRYSVQPQVLGAACWAFSDTKDVPDAQPLYTSPPQRKPEPVALDWLHKWANQDDGEPETQWHEGYEAARRVVQIHLTAPPQRNPLTEEEIGIICASLGFAQISPVEVARAVERAHGVT